jgi:Ni,Fe-hydrogenase III large subunit
MNPAFGRAPARLVIYPVEIFAATAWLARWRALLGSTLICAGTRPTASIRQLDFKVITRSEGDVWARTLVRIDEVLQSLHLCRQILDDLPRGEISVRSNRRVPSGEVLVRAEAPRGELVYYHSAATAAINRRESRSARQP